MDRVNPACAVEYAYDDRGRRCTYDAYGREISLTATRGGETFALFARSWDAAKGRLSGCAYGNVEFAYGRLAGTDLLSEIAVMGGYVMTKRVGYAADRDLPVEIAYEKSDAALLAKRAYDYDALGRVSARTQTRGSVAARSDSFGYNARSELTSATLGSDAYAYAFDYIGNRGMATEKDASLSYVTNSLNQYSGITSSGEATFQSLVENPSEENFSPTYDADGNATLVRTSTGTWSISYNGENRPIRFENAAAQTVVECAYDSQGRRFEKKVTVAGALTLHERYVYDGYLQIAAFDVSTDAAGTESFALKRVIFWDPEEPTATRPLAINVLGDNLYFPTVDLTKNVCELVDFYGDVTATYDYAPFGAVSAGTPSGAAVPANPFQWSSEVYDSELGLVYYNYRHYSPSDGRFLSRDPIEEQGGWNLYAFVGNCPIEKSELAGLSMVDPGAGIYVGWYPMPPSWGDKRPTWSPPSEEICEKYKSMPSNKSKCCRDGNWVEDEYPNSAYDVCKQFVRLYGNTEWGGQMYKTADCLTSEEMKIENEPSCSKRNEMRMNAHIKCYSSSLFFPVFGFPSGGKDVGRNLLYEDWEKTANPVVKFFVNQMFRFIPERERKEVLFEIRK